jgi:hypothetical protein
MRFTNKILFAGKTTAINLTKTIHRAITAIGPRVPHTIIITAAPTATNPAPRPHTTLPSLYTVNPSSPYITNSREKITSGIN